MLSLLIIVSLAAGICYGQDPSKFSDCATASSIAEECATAHLEYLNTVNPDRYTQMQQLSQIDLPNILVDMLDDICNDTMHLGEYYDCTFIKLKTCLEQENSTQLMRIPDAKRIAMGIKDTCKEKDDMNKTCIDTKISNVIECFGKSASDDDRDVCTVTSELIDCTDELLECEGGDAVKDFVISARPESCPYSSSAQSFLPSVLIVVGMLFTHFTRFQ